MKKIKGKTYFIVGGSGKISCSSLKILEKIKNLPIWFIVEDNNLSILTEKKVRRNWEMGDVAKSFGLESFDVEDSPKEIWNCFNFSFFFYIVKDFLYFAFSFGFFNRGKNYHTSSLVGDYHLSLIHI